MPLELAVIVPTYNERDNVCAVAAAVDKALTGISWELIFVDDNSRDGTFDLILEMARRDSRVRGIRRVGRRGLASACIEGMLATCAIYIAVMDADLQHDEALLSAMLTELRRGDLDLVVGSRYIDGGSVGDWTALRERGSRFMTWLGQALLKVKVADPMSGFFMLKRTFLDRVVPQLSGIGFKVLIDIISSARGDVRIKELPYEFRPRSAGISKLDTLVVWEYFHLLLDKSLGRLIPVRFAAFSINGGVGLIFHLAVLGILYRRMEIDFYTAQALATLVAMTNNFFLNNLLTYRDQRFRGLSIFAGLGGFYLACGLGAVTNLQLAEFLFGYGVPWSVAGIVGALVGAVWNYAVTSSLVWRSRSP